MQIIDLTGQNVFSTVISNGSYHFNPDVAPGIYFIKIISKANVYVTKVYIR